MLHTYLLKLLDQMCKYEMDSASIVEDTEQTQTDELMDRQTDGWRETSIPPFNFIEAGGTDMHKPCFLIQPLEQHGKWQNSCIWMYRTMLIN